MPVIDKNVTGNGWVSYENCILPSSIDKGDAKKLFQGRDVSPAGKKTLEEPQSKSGESAGEDRLARGLRMKKVGKTKEQSRFKELSPKQIKTELMKRAEREKEREKEREFLKNSEEEILSIIPDEPQFAEIRAAAIAYPKEVYLEEIRGGKNKREAEKVVLSLVEEYRKAIAEERNLRL